MQKLLAQIEVNGNRVGIYQTDKGKFLVSSGSLVEIFYSLPIALEKFGELRKTFETNNALKENV